VGVPQAMHFQRLCLTTHESPRFRDKSILRIVGGSLVFTAITVYGQAHFVDNQVNDPAPAWIRNRG
jgi:hypothetical protein